eukprot:Gb_05599 [translate_table: standard]
MAHEQQRRMEVTDINQLSAEEMGKNVNLEGRGRAYKFDNSEFVTSGIVESADVLPTGVYQVPHTREATFVRKIPAPGTGVEDNAAEAGIKAPEGARDRPGKLEPTAADDCQLSSGIINVQGYTTPSANELQKEELTVTGTRKEYHSVKELLEQLKLVPRLFDIVNEKTIDMMVKFGKREVALSGRLPLSQTYEKPTMYLQKQGIVTAEDVYLLLLVDVDFASLEKNEAPPLYLQWMVQNVRLPSGTHQVDVVNRLGREIQEYKSCGKPGGVHGHVFLLYQQEKPLPTNVAKRIQREGFDPKSFFKAERLEHPDPVLAFYYETETE